MHKLQKILMDKLLKEQQGKKRLNMISFLRIVIACLFVFVVTSFYIIFKDNYQVDEYFSSHAYQYCLEDSFFYKYQGKIYTKIIGKGYIAVPEADAATFQVFPESLRIQRIGWDKSHVFCNNQIVPLQPPITPIGNDLFTDGKDTYFCASRPDFKAGTNDYPPIKQVGSNGQKFSALNSSPYLSTDGTYFYYQGEKIEGAKDTIFPILELRDRDENSKKMSVSCYFSDGKRVFYKNHLLDETFTDDLVTDIFSNHGYFEYLYHLNGGKVFIDGKPFMPNEAPYHLLISDNSYTDHLFFTNENGVYYYDLEEKEAKKAMDSNPFKGYKKEDNGYFYNEKNILFFRPRTHIARGRRFKGKTSYSTEICLLKNTSPAEFKNIIKQKALSSEEYEVLAKAKTSTVSFWDRYFVVLLLIILTSLSYIIRFIFRRYNITIDPFLLDENYLRINNLVGKRYLITDIQKVVFTIHKEKNISGKMRIVSKSKGSSPSYSVKSRKKTETALLERIKDLQLLLESQNIKVEIDTQILNHKQTPIKTATPNKRKKKTFNKNYFTSPIQTL